MLKQSLKISKFTLFALISILLFIGVLSMILVRKNQTKDKQQEEVEVIHKQFPEPPSINNTTP